MPAVKCLPVPSITLLLPDCRFFPIADIFPPLSNTVLLRGGKISAIGKNLQSGNSKVIDGTGKHLTAGIIDEHSHIAVTGGVNECSQSVTAEVRIADVIDPEDINIYRQLAG